MHRDPGTLLHRVRYHRARLTPPLPDPGGRNLASTAERRTHRSKDQPTGWVNGSVFDLRLGDRSRLDRIGHHHPTGVAGQQRRDRARVPGRLQRHLIQRSEVRGNARTPSGVVANLPA
jgi:hypothetical protein